MCGVDTAEVTYLLAAAGAAPGAGKSTLCAGVVDWLRERGLRVDHFREEEVLTRKAFAPLAHEFTTTGQVQLPTLLEATEAYLAGLKAKGIDVAVTDALVPFVPSLIGWGYSEAAMASFLQDLATRIAWAEPTVLYLDDDPALAVPRAIDREGPNWEDWLVTKLGSYPVEPRVRDRETACHYLRYEREVTLRLLAQLPWRVIMVAQTNPPSVTEVQRLACDRLAELYTAPKA